MPRVTRTVKVPHVCVESVIIPAQAYEVIGIPDTIVGLRGSSRATLQMPERGRFQAQVAEDRSELHVPDVGIKRDRRSQLLDGFGDTPTTMHAPKELVPHQMRVRQRRIDLARPLRRRLCFRDPLFRVVNVDE